MITEFQFLGTGNARQVPCYGCDCVACVRARAVKDYRRGPCSAKITTPEGVILLDAGQTNLTERFAPSELHSILLTHYHMDHVQGLFHLRWGKASGLNVPVYGPDDDKGCDDLFKHPGILTFLPPPELFKPFELAGLSVTPVPLNHSKPCIGYIISDQVQTIAYFTDTLGLPENTYEYLSNIDLHTLIIDCSFPPRPEPQNHNSLTEALTIIERLNPKSTYLTHIGHDLDSFLMAGNYSLPANVFLAKDNQTIIAEKYQHSCIGGEM
ncbi:MAG: phosphonate metabolism protein PhnP [Cellvibrionaceae bacterium]